MSLETVRQLAVKSESELEQMLIENPDAIEEGLRILENQVPASRGFIDLLAVDADGTLVVVELKKESDDRILTQALEYYDFVRDNSERFAQIYSDDKIKARVEPRLLLVASAYSPTLLAAARYTNVPLTLYTYAYLGMGDMQGLYLTEVNVPPPREFGRERRSVDQHMAYITDDAASETCRHVLTWLSDLDPDQIRAHGLKYRISVKYRGNNFVDIETRRNYFHVRWRPDWTNYQIASSDDFTDDIKHQLRQSFAEMGGLPPDIDEVSPQEEQE
jgi:Holliday junction resolvase-like predicted endonuclease